MQRKSETVQFCSYCGTKTWHVGGVCEWSDGHNMRDQTMSDEEIKFVPIPSGETVTSTFTLNIPPWFPFTVHLGDCTITLHADGKWEGSVEALREAMATGKAYSDGNARMLLWLILRQMEADQRFW
jgi:hypothetical protein